MFKLFQAVLERISIWAFLRSPRRGLFRYFNGYRYVYGDPIEIQELLDTDAHYIASKHPELATQDGPAGSEAYQVCLSAYRRAFNLRKYDPQTRKGLTNAEIDQLVILFYTFVEALKKNIEDSPMPSQFTAEPTLNDSESETPKPTSD